MVTPVPPAAAAFPDPIVGLIPFGSICTFSGASGVGKTAFIAGTITVLQRGEPLFGHQTNPPPKIGLLVSDRPWRDHAQWFEKAGCGDLPHVSLRDIDDYQWKLFREYKAEDVASKLFGGLLDALDLPPGSLVIVDPLPLFLSGRLIDYKDVAISFGLLDQQLRKRQLTMLGVFHVSKQKANRSDRYLRPQDRILGSAALIGYSETSFYLLSPEEAEHHAYEFGAIAHQLPPITLQYKRNDHGLFVPAHELDGINQEEQAFNCFPPIGESVSASIIIDKVKRTLGCAETWAKKLIGRLLEDGRVKRLGRGLYERAKPS